MALSPITKTQWISIIKNAVITGVSTFVLTWQVSANPFSKVAFFSAGTAAVTAFIKIVEKAFTQG